MSYAVRTGRIVNELLRMSVVRSGTGPEKHYNGTPLRTVMAVTYWRCADCGNAIQEIKMSRLWDVNSIGEYCDICNIWNPEVVVAYD